MATNDSLQILSMILNKKQASNESAKQRGHEITMGNILAAERNLENQLQRNFQRQQNTESQIANLRSNLSARGIKFGEDSQLGDMTDRIEGSLVEQRDQLKNITSMQENELRSLEDMQSSYSRGATFAQSTTGGVTFDENFNVEPTSDFGRYRGSVGNNDQLLSMFQEKGVQVGESAREKTAFAQGASQIFADTDRLLDSEAKRASIRSQNAQRDAAALSEHVNAGQLFNNRQEAKERLKPDLTGNMFGLALELANSETDQSRRDDILDMMSEEFSRGSQSFTTQVANLAGVDLKSLDEDSAEGIYFAQVEQSFAEKAHEHVSNITTNQEAVINSLEGSLKELDKAFKDYDTLEEIIKNRKISPSDLGNILGFAGNPYISPTFATGFDNLNDIMSRMKARENLDSYDNETRAYEMARKALRDEDVIKAGNELRSAISRNMVKSLEKGKGEGNQSPETGTPKDTDSPLDSFSRMAEDGKSFTDRINEFRNISTNLGGPVGNYASTVATVPYRILNQMTNIPGYWHQYSTSVDKKYYKDLAKNMYGDDLGEEMNSLIESGEAENEDEATVILVRKYLRNNS